MNFQLGQRRMYKLDSLVQPSSATAEQVFSRLESSFSHTSLEDCIPDTLYLFTIVKIECMLLFCSFFTFQQFLHENINGSILNGSNGLNFLE